MTIQDLGSLGELVAAVATVVTLVYLAIQIRQNTTSARTATYQNIVTTGMELGNTFARDEGVADLFARGADSPEVLTRAEMIRLHSPVSSVFRCYELVFPPFELGALDAPAWDGWRGFTPLFSGTRAKGCGRPAPTGTWRRGRMSWSG